LTQPIESLELRAAELGGELFPFAGPFPFPVIVSPLLFSLAIVSLLFSHW
jgi:hypothetical protein